MRKKILLIEDDKIVRENTSEILQFSNYDVITASNGKIGIQKALKNTVDLVICDIMMPKLDGYGVYKILKTNEKYKNIPFIFLSARTNRSDRRKGMELGADDYLTKPFDESELLNTIEIRIQKSTRNGEEIKNKKKPILESFQKVKNLDELIKNIGKKNNYTYDKGETLFKENHRSIHIFFIKEGVIKTFKITKEGKELISNIYKKNQFIGYTASLGDFPYFENAEIIEKSIIIKIEKEEIKKILTNNSHIALDFLEILSNNIENIKTKLLQTAYDSVRMRVARSLLMAIEGDPLKKIYISRTNLAYLTGIAKETLIRTLSDFRDEGLLESNRTCINIVNENGLRKIR